MLTPPERRREKLRLHIISVADRLYKKNGADDGGFENTKVEAIAEHSDISLRTFFRYFECKADVIYLDVKNSVVHLRHFMSERLKQEPVPMALLNARFDQFEWITSTDVGRERLLRALRAPQFRARLVLMREDAKATLAELLLPYMMGIDAERHLKARTHAIVYNGLFTDAYDQWAENPAIDLREYVLEALALLPQLASDALQHRGQLERRKELT